MTICGSIELQSSSSSSLAFIRNATQLERIKTAHGVQKDLNRHKKTIPQGALPKYQHTFEPAPPLGIFPTLCIAESRMQNVNQGDIMLMCHRKIEKHFLQHYSVRGTLRLTS